MPAEAPTIVPPTAPQRPAAPGAPSAVPASSGEIHVSPGKLTPVAPEPPKPGSAKAKLRESLEAKSNANPRTAQTPTPPKPAERPGTSAAPAEATKPGEAAPAAAPAAAEAAKPGESTTVDPKDSKKPSPWKLLEESKSKLAKAESELTELRKGQLSEPERKSLTERVEKAEAEAKELRQKLVDKDWTESDDYKAYQAQYDNAWRVAMGEMKGVKVAGEDGVERDVTPDDLLTIVNAPMAQARQLADKYFGAYANDVMLHRNKIRDLFDNQNKTLETKKAESLAKKQQETEVQTKAAKELTETISRTWQQENQAILSDEKYGQLFKPREGDEQWNQRLAKGFELVDRAFSQNPSDPRLKPEERAAVIRRHAAVRNRAASWGPLRGEVERLTTENKALLDELAQYKGTEPPSGTARTPAPAGAPGGGSAKSSIMEELRKKAR